MAGKITAKESKSDAKGALKHHPKKHHIDRRAHQIVLADVGADDELLDTKQVAAWMGISVQWLEIGRSKNYGPRYTKLGPRIVRYRRGDVLAWLKSRTRQSTAEYAA